MGNEDIRKGHTSREDRWVRGDNSKITKLKVLNDQAGKRSKEICSDKARSRAALGRTVLEYISWRIFHCLRHTQLSHQGKAF